MNKVTPEEIAILKRIAEIESIRHKTESRLNTVTDQNAWHGVDTESFVDGVRTGELDLRKGTK